MIVSGVSRRLEMFSILVVIVAVSSTVQGELINDPIIKPTPNFNVSSDAGIIRKEVQDKSDGDKTARIIFHRTLKERTEIKNSYSETYCVNTDKAGQNIYSCSLDVDLREISKDSVRLLYDVYMFKSPQEILAHVVHETIDGTRRSDRTAIEETICAQDNDMKDLIAKFYVQTFSVKLEDHFKKYKSQDTPYQEAMLKFCWPIRSQDLKITEQVATDEAKALQQIDTNKDKEKFQRELKKLLEMYTEPDLKMIFKKFREGKYGIDDAVEEAFDSDDEEVAYSTLVKYIENTCGYYADALQHAVDDGIGKTDIDRINRITVTRSERDMACIAKEYKKKQGETFTQRLKWDVLSETQYLECIRYLCGKP